jgi:TPR repeat protein
MFNLQAKIAITPSFKIEPAVRICWKTHPLYIRMSDIQNSFHLGALISGKLVSPLHICGGENEEFFEVIKLVDMLFHHAIDHYTKTLEIASRSDLQFISQKSSSHQTYQYRANWVKDIDNFEKDRIERTKRFLCDRASCIISDLEKAIQLNHFIDLRLTDELQQILKVYSYFCTTKESIQSKIITFLKKINIETCSLLASVEELKKYSRKDLFELDQLANPEIPISTKYFMLIENPVIYIDSRYQIDWKENPVILKRKHFDPSQLQRVLCIVMGKLIPFFETPGSDYIHYHPALELEIIFKSFINEFSSRLTEASKRDKAIIKYSKTQINNHKVNSKFRAQYFKAIIDLNLERRELNHRLITSLIKRDYEPSSKFMNYNSNIFHDLIPLLRTHSYLCCNKPLMIDNKPLTEYIKSILDDACKEYDKKVKPVSIPEPITFQEWNPQQVIIHSVATAKITPTDVHFFKEALDRAKKNQIKAMFDVAWCFANGKGVSKDFKLAKHWYQRAANKGHVAAMYNLGLLFDKRVTKNHDREKAFHWFMKAAQKGLDRAQYMVGYYYQNELGTSIDLKEAFRWYQLSAENNYPPGLEALGTCYDYGYGTEQNWFRAQESYRKAAEKGLETALFFFENCIIDGRGIARNSNSERLLLEDWKAKIRKDKDSNPTNKNFLDEHQCSADLVTPPNSEVNSAEGERLYRSAHAIVSSDPSPRLKMLKMAAKLNHPRANFELGKYYYARSTNSDIRIAANYFYRAADNGVPAAAFMIAWLIRFSGGEFFQENLLEILRLEQQAGTTGAFEAKEIVGSFKELWEWHDFKNNQDPHVRWVGWLELALISDATKIKYELEIRYALAKFYYQDWSGNVSKLRLKSEEYFLYVIERGYAEAQMDWGIHLRKITPSGLITNQEGLEKAIKMLEESIKPLNRKGLRQDQIGHVQWLLQQYYAERSSCQIM